MYAAQCLQPAQEPAEQLEQEQEPEPEWEDAPAAEPPMLNVLISR